MNLDTGSSLIQFISSIDWAFDNGAFRRKDVKVKLLESSVLVLDATSKIERSESWLGNAPWAEGKGVKGEAGNFFKVTA